MHQFYATKRQKIISRRWKHDETVSPGYFQLVVLHKEQQWAQYQRLQQQHHKQHPATKNLTAATPEGFLQKIFGRLT